MTLRLAVAAAALLSLTACTTTAAPPPPPSSTSAASTSIKPAAAAPATTTSTPSANRSALLVQIDTAAAAAGVGALDVGTAGSFTLTVCDALDGLPSGASDDTRRQAVAVFAAKPGTEKSSVPTPVPERAAALKVGVPIACPQHVPALAYLDL